MPYRRRTPVGIILLVTVATAHGISAPLSPIIYNIYTPYNINPGIHTTTNYKRICHADLLPPFVVFRKFRASALLGFYAHACQCLNCLIVRHPSVSTEIDNMIFYEIHGRPTFIFLPDSSASPYSIQPVL